MWNSETYAFQAVDTKIIKIGRVNDVRNIARRHGELERFIGEPLNFLGWVAEGERQALNDLSEWRLHGEWFRATPEVVAYLKRRLRKRPVAKWNR